VAVLSPLTGDTAFDTSRERLVWGMPALTA